VSNLKLTGGWAAGVIVTIVICVTGLELMALYKGIDGTQLVGIVGALLAFGGAIFGFKIKDVLPK